MIEHAVFYDRLENFCKLCPHWTGVCLKGHGLSTPQGCPIKLFPPVAGADYALDRPTGALAPDLVKNCSGCGAGAPTPLNWAQVLAHFTASMAAWIKAGAPLVSGEVHGLRYAQCKACPQFRSFYCGHCKCLAYLKTRLATESCPLLPPRWTSASAQDA